MGGKASGLPASPPEGVAEATFSLERFEWSAPDRIEIAGRFANVPENALADPVLVVRGGDSTHRLVPAADSERQAGRVGLRRFGGTRWRASFAWPGQPTSFDRAVLELGEEFVVALPAPGAIRSGRRALRVSRREPPTLGPAERIGLQAELAATREEAEDLRGRLEQAQQVARRLRQDMDAQRKRREAESKRFHETLAGMRGTAEEAVYAERRNAETMRAELEEARRAAEDAEKAADEARRDLAAMRDELAAASDARGVEERLQAELDEERRQLAEVREELQRARDETDAALRRISGIGEGVDDLANAERELAAMIERLRAELSDGRATEAEELRQYREARLEHTLADDPADRVDGEGTAPRPARSED